MSTERGALLRREGLYSSHMAEWRKARDAGARDALAPKGKARRSPAELEVERLRRRNERLETDLARTKLALEITGKAHALGHIAICVYAAVIEALITAALAAADIRDPDLPDQHLSAARALRELARVRAVTLDAGDRHVDVVTRRSALQGRILDALHVDTNGWNRAHIT